MRERWFKLDPGQFVRACATASLELRGAYGLLLAETYINGGPLRLPEDEAYLCHALGVNKPRLRRILRDLVRVGGLAVSEDGQITPKLYDPARWGRRAATLEERARIVARDGAACRACGSADGLTVDHIIPVVRGGSDRDDNLQILCRSCNASKGPRE